MKTLADLIETLPQTGRITWIGLRPERRAPIVTPRTAFAEVGSGLSGDRYSRSGGPRQVTLLQAEHLPAVASMLGVPEIEPQQLRRNLMVAGINLLALKGQRFQVGDAIFEYTGPCHPCSRMETELGPGGYNAMRGHGGITAQVIAAGAVEIGSVVRVIPQENLARDDA